LAKQGPPKYSSFHYYFLPKTKQRAFQGKQNKAKGFSRKAKQSKGLFKQSRNKAKGWFPIAKGFFFSFLCFFLGGEKRDLILAKASYLGKETTIEKEGSDTNEWSTKGESSIL
jgi:hypothetical protein